MHAATKRHRTARYKTRLNGRLTSTSIRRGYDVTCRRTYTYKHGRHGISWRLSGCANGVHQTPFLLPLVHAWKRGYKKKADRRVHKLQIADCRLNKQNKWAACPANTKFRRRNVDLAGTMLAIIPKTNQTPRTFLHSNYLQNILKV